MMDWTDRHCRYLHRLLSRHARLYTEMVTTGALLHGDVPRHLRFNSQEQPLALQLGGSEPSDLAACARLAQQWGYDEVNLNCGCPSERVQRGAFGACLMNEPALVADCVRAMRDACDLPVTVKHRIGVDQQESFDFVSEFVGRVSEAGCSVFIVHARSAWLQGLSPKQNREVPPLRYELVHQIKAAYPHLTVVLNGGLTSTDQVLAQLGVVDGVMLGREAYHRPWWLAEWDAAFFGAGTGAINQQAVDRDAVEAEMVAYMARCTDEDGTAWSAVSRHMLGLRHGQAGARRWRQVWSDHRLKHWPAQDVHRLAQQALAEAAMDSNQQPALEAIGSLRDQG